jgi:oxygen-independent coproporphyrinogen-3 oxidase
MNRAHTAQQSDYALKAAQDIGYTNLSIDLIYGTPGLSDEAWLENIRRMAMLRIPHFSAYALTVEEGTALHHAITKKAAAPVDPAQSAVQAQLLVDEAKSLGYDQYEISNFAKPGCYAVHNTSYWQGKPYLGLGPSAHSFDGHRTRQWNIANNALYIKSVLTENKVPFEQEKLSTIQRLNEYIMTSLRTMWGCDLDKVQSEWGRDYRLVLQQESRTFVDNGRMEAIDAKLKLTNKGKLFADGIAAELFFSEKE